MSDDEERKRTFDKEYEEFLSKNQDKFVAANARSVKLNEIVKNLQFWIKFSSWSYCTECSQLSREKLYQPMKKRQ